MAVAIMYALLTLGLYPLQVKKPTRSDSDYSGFLPGSFVRTYPGHCPIVTAMDNFTLEPFMDSWYHRWQSGDWDIRKCPRSRYYFIGPIAFDFRHWERGKSSLFTGRGRYTADIRRGQIIKPRFIAHPRNKPAEQYRKPGYPSYTIMDTDYNTHAIVFSCFTIKVVNEQGEQIGVEHIPKLEIITRRWNEFLENEESIKARALELVKKNEREDDLQTSEEQADVERLS